MTRAEANQLLTELSELFGTAYLVEPGTGQAWLPGPEGVPVRGDCFSVRRRGTRCESCIAVRACEEALTLDSYQVLSGEVFHITAKRCEVEGIPYALGLAVRLDNPEEYFRREDQARELRDMTDALNNLNDGVFDLLGDVIESRDQRSGEHVHRVKSFTYILATQVMRDCPEYDLTEQKVELMTSASTLHDVGKISISDSILLKPGKLTDEEFTVMKTHCDKGCDVLKKLAGYWSDMYLSISLDICRYHHEKWDGDGYPLGLKGDEIPITAQIVSIADCYDALTTQRVYKEAYAPDLAFDMILRGECGQFSDKLLTCLKKVRKEFEECAADHAVTI